MLALNVIYNLGSRVYNNLNKETVSSFIKASLKVAAIVSIPAIAVFALLGRKPTVSAGLITYRSCVQGCINLGGPPPFIAACIAACTFTLGPWCP